MSGLHLWQILSHMSITHNLALGCLIIGTLVWLLLEEVILIIIPDPLWNHHGFQESELVHNTSHPVHIIHIPYILAPVECIIQFSPICFPNSSSKILPGGLRTHTQLLHTFDTITQHGTSITIHTAFHVPFIVIDEQTAWSEILETCMVFHILLVQGEMIGCCQGVCRTWEKSLQLISWGIYDSSMGETCS